MSTASANHETDPRNRRYGFVGILVSDREKVGARINQILADHSSMIVGRLGMPNLEEGGLAIITLILHATTDQLGSLTGKLGALSGVSVKSALHKPRPDQHP